MSDNDIDDDCEYVRCEDCKLLTNQDLYDCPDDIRRCERCFNRAAEAYYAGKDIK